MLCSPELQGPAPQPPAPQPVNSVDDVAVVVNSYAPTTLLPPFPESDEVEATFVNFKVSSLKLLAVIVYVSAVSTATT